MTENEEINAVKIDIVVKWVVMQCETAGGRNINVEFR
jgi:hypothetical protein